MHHEAGLRPIVVFLVLLFASAACKRTDGPTLQDVAMQLDSGRYAQAIRYLDRIAANGSFTPEAWNMRAVAFYGLGLYDSALLCCTESIQIDSTDYRPWYNRANAHYRLGQPDAALSDYTRAIDLRPDRPDLYINRGNALLLAGVPLEALEDFDFALRLDRDNYLASFNRARCFYTLGHLDSAAVLFQNCIEREVSYAPAFYFLALVRGDQGLREEACLLARKAIELGHPEARKAIEFFCGTP
jgi:tetratricopeptide (TPR) repeat protein